MFPCVHFETSLRARVLGPVTELIWWHFSDSCYIVEAARQQLLPLHVTQGRIFEVPVDTLPKINMSPENGAVSKENSSSNHQFSGDMLVFRGVVLGCVPKKLVCHWLIPLIQQ